MNLFSSIDSMFATFFALVTVGSVIGLTYYTFSLSKKDVTTVINSQFSSAVIGLFFVAMLIPTFGFCFKGLYATGAMCMVMAGVVSMCLEYMSRRAALVLNVHFGF